MNQWASVCLYTVRSAHSALFFCDDEPRDPEESRLPVMVLQFYMLRRHAAARTGRDVSSLALQCVSTERRCPPEIKSHSCGGFVHQCESVVFLPGNADGDRVDPQRLVARVQGWDWSRGSLQPLFQGSLALQSRSGFFTLTYEGTFWGWPAYTGAFEPIVRSFTCLRCLIVTDLGYKPALRTRSRLQHN